MNDTMIPTSKEHAEYIKQHIPPEDLYNQLAEEAAELSQAANKMVRILRGNNPTPVNAHEAMNNVVEEYSDVVLVANNLLDIHPDELINDYKLYRWHRRISQVQPSAKDYLPIEPPEELKRSHAARSVSNPLNTSR